jgi:hypothetical protein
MQLVPRPLDLAFSPSIRRVPDSFQETPLSPLRLGALLNQIANCLGHKATHRLVTGRGEYTKTPQQVFRQAECNIGLFFHIFKCST